MPEERRNTDVLHERTDVHVRAVTATGAGLFLGMVAIVLLLWFLFEWFRRADVHVEGREGVAPSFSRIREPLLQDSPRRDLEEMRRQEDWALRTYHWVDRQRGIVSIPIERAIELAAQRGLPPAAPAGNLQLTPPSTGHRQTGFEDKTMIPGEP